MRRIAGYALVVYGALTIAALMYFILVWRSPELSLSDLGSVGPRTNPISLELSLAMTWLLTAIILVLAYLDRITPKTAVLVACGAAVAVLYLVFLRERSYFGDYRAYMRAAENIIANQPFHSRYVYPPLLASILAHICRVLGSDAAVLVWFALNHLSLWAFFVLGSLLLYRCGLSLHLSSILLAVAMCVNVPVLRNMVYVQTNLLFLDFILASILLMPRSRLVSALSLAVGTHLKVVPILFLPVFAYTKRYAWLVFYFVLGLAIVVITSVTDGISYYRYFFNNLSSWDPAALRSSSIDSLLVNTNRYLGSNLPAQAISITLKVVLVFWLYFLAYSAIRKRAFSQSDVPVRDVLINGAVPLMFLVPAVLPTVWVHHLVILIIPAVLLALRLRTRLHILLFAFGYLFTFLLPVFDCYPWSYLRLAGWLMLLGLMSDAVLKPGVSSWVGPVDEKIVSIVESLQAHHR